MKTAIQLVLIAATTTCSCCAQQSRSRSVVLWSPPNISWPGDLPTSTIPTVPKEMIQSIRVGDMPIVFESTKLEEVQRRFGGVIGTHGDAGDSLAWLCFQGESADKPWIFWVTSDEIEGLTWINGFQWRFLAPSERADHRCKPLPYKNPIDLSLPIRLGLSRSEVQQVVGRPTRARRDALFFLHERREKDHKELVDVWNSVTVFFQNGVASIIEGDKSTTN